MHWKLKAKIQNAVSLLPSSVSYAAYYWIQRHFGQLRRVNPISRLTKGIETWKYILKQGKTPLRKVFFEVGTGWMPIVPLAYWLMGAKKTVSIDLNPYLKAELIAENLVHIVNNQREILNLFGPLIVKDRFEQLLALNMGSNFSMSEFLDLCRIEYLAPGDASDTYLAENSIDFHTSFTVFEHIPPEVLKQILEEGNRIIKNDGLFIHRIDYSDHFAHSYKSISRINFLQYSDDKWKKITGNRYMYMNRLRHDDFFELFESVGHQVLEAQPDTDQRSEELLRKETFKPDIKFSSKSKEVLAITGAWIISRIDG